jgi:hypothetical protein
LPESQGGRNGLEWSTYPQISVGEQIRPLPREFERKLEDSPPA